jgi:hypothetical protein
MSDETVLANALVVTADDAFVGHVVVAGGTIRSVGRGPTATSGAIDLGGDWLLPGFVEVHTDNLEKHMLPRPGVLWDAYAATVVHDAQCAGAGITTVLDAVVIGSRDLGGGRSLMQDTAIESLQRCREDGVLRVEHLLHLRCELATADVLDRFMLNVDRPDLRLVSVMDHTPGQRQWRDLAKYRQYMERNGRYTEARFNAMLAEQHLQHEAHADANRRAVVEAADVAEAHRAGLEAQRLGAAQHRELAGQHAAHVVAGARPLARLRVVAPRLLVDDRADVLARRQPRAEVRGEAQQLRGQSLELRTHEHQRAADLVVLERDLADQPDVDRVGQPGVRVAEDVDPGLRGLVDVLERIEQLVRVVDRQVHPVAHDPVGDAPVEHRRARALGEARQHREDARLLVRLDEDDRHAAAEQRVEFLQVCDVVQGRIRTVRVTRGSVWRTVSRRNRWRAAVQGRPIDGVPCGAGCGSRRACGVYGACPGDPFWQGAASPSPT